MVLYMHFFFRYAGYLPSRTYDNTSACSVLAVGSIGSPKLAKSPEYLARNRYIETRKTKDPRTAAQPKLNKHLTKSFTKQTTDTL